MCYKTETYLASMCPFQFVWFADDYLHVICVDSKEWFWKETIVFGLQQKPPPRTIHLASERRQSSCAMITFLQRTLITDISLTTGIRTPNVGSNFWCEHAYLSRYLVNEMPNEIRSRSHLNANRSQTASLAASYSLVSIKTAQTKAGYFPVRYNNQNCIILLF